MRLLVEVQIKKRDLNGHYLMRTKEAPRYFSAALVPPENHMPATILVLKDSGHTESSCPGHLKAWTVKLSNQNERILLAIDGCIANLN